MPQSQPKAKFAVIGGTGLYDIEGITDVQEVNLDTPFGKPSDTIVVGKLGGVGVAFLPRHGRGHRIPPTDVPYRANIFALKSLGVEFIIGINSVGSFQEEIKPGHLLIPDQLIDRTRSRVSTFFREDIVAHIAFAEPFCPLLSQTLYLSAHEAGATVHRSGTYLVMEGPAFSTKAESRLYRSWGADVIGMTALPEAKLAREAEMCYAIIACVTDYDSWHEAHEAVTVEVILNTLRKNIEVSKKIIKLAISKIPATHRDCQCAAALKMALVTAPDLIPPDKKQHLDLFIGKYMKKEK
ncbi:MAG: S-methyl-5'-thioadenosine phosphorylase [Dehalococcoidales bacterium]|nr:S-methyl-5'-thioadenosine phosphorylase [Dehalococcoidales bacterium]